MLILCAAFLVTGALVSFDERGQLSPPPGDGEIRVVYWELRNETEVWLTLEAKSATGKAAPLLTFARRFAGKYPVSQATDFEGHRPRGDVMGAFDGVLAGARR